MPSMVRPHIVDCPTPHENVNRIDDTCIVASDLGQRDVRGIEQHGRANRRRTKTDHVAGEDKLIGQHPVSAAAHDCTVAVGCRPC
jgi:hypothetical protein